MKAFIVTVSTLILFTSASVVLAESSPTPKASPTTIREKRMEIKENVKTQIQEKRTEIKDKREGAKNKLTAIRRERIRSYFNQMIVRLEATLERLHKLSTRISERVDKIKTEDPQKDLTKIQAKLEQANDILLATDADLKILKGKDELILDAADPKDEFEKVKGDIETIKYSFKQTYKLFVEIIGDVKGLHVGESK